MEINNKGSVYGLFCLMAALLICLTPQKAAAEETEGDTIYDGIYLDDISVGGMTSSEAKAQYESYLETLRNVTVEFDLEDESYSVPMAELGLVADVDAAVEEAYEYGRRGNILKRYREITDVAKNKVEIPVSLSLNEEHLVELLDENLSDYITPAKNAGLVFSDGSLQVVPGENGKELNTAETVEKLKEAVSVWSVNETETVIQIEVVTNELVPEHSSEELAVVTDVLGSFDTHYSAGDPSRNNNIMNAANKISNMVVYPGEEFDTMSHLLPFTTANGWSYAGAYLNGEVISDIGGGICQVSTTLYNAVLNAELEVTERYPHSMAVGYVQLSADAALNEGTKNFRFVNNTDNPIFVYAYASGGTMHVSIYGKEYRSAGRTVEYKNEILEVIPAGDPIQTVDESQPADYREVKQTAHTGYRARLWKYIYENGQLVDKILVNTSTYNSSPERVVIGNPEAATEAPPAEPDTSTDTPGEPASTEEPTTEAPTTETEAPQ